MGGDNAEPGGTSPYEDEDYGDDDFEEHDGVPSAKKPQSLAAVGQVHPLDSVSDDAAKLAAARKADAALAGDEVDDDEEGGGEYSDDDFEGEKTAPSVEKFAVPTTFKVNLLAKSEDDTSTAALVTYSTSNDDTDGDGDADNGDCVTDSSADAQQQDTAHREATAAKPAGNVVSLHAHREPEALLPSPPPIDPTSSLQHDTETKRQQVLLLSEKRASVAAKRVLEYREIQAQHEAQQAAEAAVSKKKREHFRASNRNIYEQMGVSKLTGEQRYQLLIEEKKLLKQHRDANAKLEKHQRWYNAKAAESNRKSLAPAHVAELQAQYRGICKQRHRDTVQRSQIIKAHQVELHQQAQEIVAKCTLTQYIRGSYLLKITAKTKQTQKAKSKSVPLTQETYSNNTAQSRENPASISTPTPTSAPTSDAEAVFEIAAT